MHSPKNKDMKLLFPDLVALSEENMKKVRKNTDFRLSTKGSEKPFSLSFVIFSFRNGGKKADFRFGRLLSGGRAVSLLVADAPVGSHLSR
ncbi:hypothetical protein J27TS8_21190 [Robertmurraya siralis]|uniref:Uncharacterized protein n=1 Tax=Robertmurraya siralis TaxID=77777 RepID=A0A919WHJ3_9BACI|nr:hypothetical protein J27TS8_21190 [Robertmurraya siralis]